MTKSELIEILTRRQAHLKADDVDLAVKNLLEMMSNALTQGERISLGVKQLEQDPIGTMMATTQKGAIVTGTVKEVDARGATIELEGGVEGYVKANDIAKERVEDATHYLKVGDKVEAKYIGMDRKGRTMQLSIKAKDEADVAESMAEVNKASDASSGTTKLGALLREQLNKGE